MIVKRPFVVDLWEGNAVQDWAFADGYIFCASWRRLIEDAKFGTHWRQAANMGLPRAAYYALYFDIPIADQARKFAAIVKEYGLRPNDRLWMDAEVGTPTAQGILDFAYNVEQQTGIRPGIYTWPWLLNGLDLSRLTNAQRAYFKTLPVWAAGWPNNPDLFSAPPSGYIPDLTRFSNPVVWQYAGDKNPADWGLGVTGGIDFDWVDPDYWRDWSGEVVADLPTPHIYTVKRSLSEYELCFTPGSGELPLLSAAEAAAKFGWEAAMNGGAGFTYNADYTCGIPKSAGFELITVGGASFRIARRMVTNYLTNSELTDNPNRGPWSILGLDAQGNAYFFVTEGVEPNGFTQWEAAMHLPAEIKDAYLMDSGHSSQIFGSGVDYWPYGIGNLPAPERVPQHIGLKRKEQTVTTYTGTVKSTATPYVVVRRSSDGAKVGQLNPGTRITGDSVFAVTTLQQYRAGNWMHLTTPIVGYASVDYLNYTADTVTPPVDPPPPADDIVLKSWQLTFIINGVEKTFSG